MVARTKKKKTMTYPRYVAKILAAQEAGLIPKGINGIEVIHDSFCPILETGECTCDPEIVVNGVPVKI